MKNPDKVIKEAVKDAAHTLAEYLHPGERNCKETVNKLLTTHTARHTFATTITLENDVPIETVSKMLGHKDIRTTQIYAKITKRKISNNMKVLHEKLFEINGALKLAAAV